MSHTLRCCETEANTRILSPTNQLVPPKLETRRGEHKGSYCALMFQLEQNRQAQTHKNI